MGQHAFIVLPGHHLQTAIFNRRVGNGTPDRHHLGVISFRVGNPPILMPVRQCYVGPNLILLQRICRRLDANVLDRIGGDLRADQILDQIQQTVIGDQVKDCRAKMQKFRRLASLKTVVEKKSFDFQTARPKLV